MTLEEKEALIEYAFSLWFQAGFVYYIFTFPFATVIAIVNCIDIEKRKHSDYKMYKFSIEYFLLLFLGLTIFIRGVACALVGPLVFICDLVLGTGIGISKGMTYWRKLQYDKEKAEEKSA